MSIEIDHRIEYLTAPRRSGFFTEGGRDLKLSTHRTTPCESMKNVTRPSLRPIRPRPTLYAFRASPDSSLNIGYCYLLLSGRVWRGRHSAHTVTLCFVAKSLIAGTGSAEIPTTVMPESLNSTFSKCTRYPSAVISLSHFIMGLRRTSERIPESADFSRAAISTCPRPMLLTGETRDYDVDKGNAPALG